MNYTVKKCKTFRQQDSRWGSLTYAKSPYFMSNAGCGPTACADIIVSNPKYAKITPKTTRKYMLDHNYVVNGQGTKWAGIPACLNAYGYNCKNHATMDGLWEELKKGNRCGVLLFRKGTRGGVTWTSGGHFVAFTGFRVINGKHYLYTRDPNSARHNDGWFCYETTMMGLVIQVWSCYLPSETKNESKKTGTALVAEEAEKVYKAAIGCKHVNGTKATTFEKMKQMKELSCNRIVSIVLQEAGYLAKGKVIGHTKASKNKDTIAKALKNGNLLKDCDIIWVNKKYANLPDKYKVPGAVYIYNSNAAISAGNGYIWSCNASGGYDKKKQEYVKYKNGILSKKGYSFDSPVLVVIMAKDKGKKEEPKKEESKTETKKKLYGVDVSAHQPENIFQIIPFDFGIVKMTGNPKGYKWDYVNDRAKKQAKDAYSKTGLLGLYHFTYGLEDATKEADFFVKKVKELGYLGKAMLVIDYEGENALKRGRNWVKKLCDRVTEKAGYEPIIYASYSIIQSQTLGSLGYKIWCANYSKSYAVINGYNTSGCKLAYGSALLWQFTSKGRLKGYSNDLDLDVFFGSEADFKSYMKKKKERVYPELPKKGYFAKGDKGVNVARLQKLLNKAGFNCGEADGIFGDKTEAAVKKLQKKYKLDQTGRYGKKTHAALKKALK